MELHATLMAFKYTPADAEEVAEVNAIC